MPPGTLTLVSLPIGNPEDISVRALRVLKEVRAVVAEDTRVTRRLFQRLGIETELLAFRPQAGMELAAPLIQRLTQGENLALVSDAGTPMVADPGLTLVRAALRADIVVTAVPGACAAVTALLLSGLPTGRFAFDGFPPRARSDRAAFFAALAKEERTLLLYESRSHLKSTLSALLTVLGPQRALTIARDLTKSSELLFRGTLQQAVTHFAVSVPPGEYTLVLGGSAVYVTDASAESSASPIGRQTDGTLSRLFRRSA